MPRFSRGAKHNAYFSKNLSVIIIVSCYYEITDMVTHHQHGIGYESELFGGPLGSSNIIPTQHI